MRLFPAVKYLSFAVFAIGAFALTASVAHAQYYQQPQGGYAAGGGSYAAPGSTAAAMQAAAAASAAQGGSQAALSKLQALQKTMLQQQSLNAGAGTAPASLFGSSDQDISVADLNDALKDPNSAQSKAHELAKEAKASGELSKTAISSQQEEKLQILDQPTPPEMDVLQNVAAAHAADRYNISDDPVNKALALDLRHDAQREAALSYGARGGLAKRAYQIMERVNDYQNDLDHVFNFRQLLIKAPSGLMIEPPIVKESLDATVITDQGNEAAVADQVLNINKQAKIVTAPRDWRQYVVMNYATEIPPPPKVLWPQNKSEQADWDGWIKQGWDAGYAQGEDIFEASLNQLVADYTGMVRYRLLLAEGKISQPFAMQEDRGVTGGKDVMRVGDRALRITGPSEFLTGADLWKPADR